jgi:hypothetical protein
MNTRYGNVKLPKIKKEAVNGKTHITEAKRKWNENGGKKLKIEQHELRLEHESSPLVFSDVRFVQTHVFMFSFSCCNAISL